MTAQGYGNQESVDETKDAKKGAGSKDVPGRKGAADPAPDRRDEATPGEGAGPAPKERRADDQEADPGLG